MILAPVDATESASSLSQAGNAGHKNRCLYFYGYGVPRRAAPSVAFRQNQIRSIFMHEKIHQMAEGLLLTESDP